MGKFAKSLAFALSILVALSASAQDKPRVVPVKEGASAPYTGLLVPKLRMRELLDTEVEADRLSIRLRLSEKYAESLEEMYDKQIEKATAEPPWWESPRANRWMGFIIGVAVTGLAFYGGIKVVESNTN